MTGRSFFLEMKFHSVTITVYDRESAFNTVSKLLHDYARFIQARLGYPVPDKNVAVIFLIMKMTTDDLGALTGKIGQLKDVNVKASTLKI
jgi:putative iron-only hydrogenase system regulator